MSSPARGAEGSNYAPLNRPGISPSTMRRPDAGQCTIGRMATRCRHDDHHMVSYVPLFPAGKRWVSTLWCPACGALGVRRYETREAVTEWKLPKRKG